MKRAAFALLAIVILAIAWFSLPPADEASKPGASESTPRNQDTATAEEASKRQSERTTAAWLSGTIIGKESRQPVQGATVLIETSSRDTGKLGSIRTHDFDVATGVFQVRRPLRGRFDRLVVSARATGHVVARKSIGIRELPCEITLELERGSRVDGKVVLSSGEPATTGDVYGMWELVATLRPDGTFSFWTSLDSVDIEAFVPGHGFGRLRHVDAPTEGPVVIEVDARRSLSGTVTDTSGAPISGAEIRVQTSWKNLMSVRTDAEGAFTVPGVPEQIQFEVDHPGYRRFFMATTLYTEIPELIRLRSGSRYRMRLLEEAGKVVDPDVVAELEVGRKLHRLTREGESYVTELLGRTHLGAIVLADGFDATPVMLPSGDGDMDVGDVVLRPGIALEVFVIDGDEAPITGARVRAGREDGKQTTKNTDDDGAVTIERLPSRGVNVEVEADGFANRTVRKHDPIQGALTVSLTKTGSVTGRVVDGSGNPLPGATARVGDLLTVGTTRADSQGVFSLELDPEEDEFDVIVRKNGYQAVTRDVESLEAGVMIDLGEVQLERACQVGGIIVDEDGEAAFRAWARFRGEPGVYRGSSEEDGRFVVENVPPGRYDVTASSSGFEKTVIRDVRVTLDEPTDIEIVLEKGFGFDSRIVDRRQNSIPHAWVVTKHGGGTEYSRADRNGRFSEWGLANTEIRIEIRGTKLSFPSPAEVPETIVIDTGGRIDLVLDPESASRFDTLSITRNGSFLEAVKIDGDGIAVIERNKPGLVELIARPPGHQSTAPFTVNVRESETTEVALDLRNLEPVEKTEILVTDTNGVPIREAELWLLTDGTYYGPRTDDDGRGELMLYGDSTQELQVRAEGFVQQTFNEFTPGELLVIELVGVCSLTVLIPVSDEYDLVTGWLESGESNIDGDDRLIHFSALRAGERELVVTRNGAAIWKDRVTLISGEHRVVRPELPAGFAVTFSILSSAPENPSTWQRADFKLEGPKAVSVERIDDGKYIAHVYEPGEYTATYRLRDPDVIRRRTLTLTGSDDIEWDTRAYPFRCRVETDEGPLASVKLQFRNRSVTTDSIGRFEVADVLPGRYPWRVNTKLDGYCLTGWIDVTETPLHVIHVKKGRRIRLVSRDPDIGSWKVVTPDGEHWLFGERGSVVISEGTTQVTVVKGDRERVVGIQENRQEFEFGI